MFNLFIDVLILIYFWGLMINDFGLIIDGVGFNFDNFSGVNWIVLLSILCYSGLVVVLDVVMVMVFNDFDCFNVVFVSYFLVIDGFMIMGGL